MNGRRCWWVWQVTADEMTDRGCLLNKRLPSGATKVCPWVCRCQTHPKNFIVTQFVQTFKLSLIGCPSCRIQNGRLGHKTGQQKLRYFILIRIVIMCHNFKTVVRFLYLFDITSGRKEHDLHNTVGNNYQPNDALISSFMVTCLKQENHNDVKQHYYKCNYPDTFQIANFKPKYCRFCQWYEAQRT